jgi:sugar/nucleoside kinase (ribokinase family)
VIVVLGRPRLDERGALSGTAGRVAVAARSAGAQVAIVGLVADDAAGDATVTELGRAGVGHAALLRQPGGGEMRPLERADIELALRYVPECRVLVAAEALAADALAAAAGAAAYHGAALICVTSPGGSQDGLPEDATVLEEPSDEEAGGAFAELIGRYAAALAGGTSAAEAWKSAVEKSGWEHTEPAESAPA